MLSESKHDKCKVSVTTCLTSNQFCTEQFCSTFQIILWFPVSCKSGMMCSVWWVTLGKLFRFTSVLSDTPRKENQRGVSYWAGNEEHPSSPFCNCSLPAISCWFLFFRSLLCACCFQEKCAVSSLQPHLRSLAPVPVAPLGPHRHWHCLWAHIMTCPCPFLSLPHSFLTPGTALDVHSVCPSSFLVLLGHFHSCQGGE